MVTVTPITGHYTRSNQDCDEQGALLGELQRAETRGQYLAHWDSFVRCYADWACEYFGIRSIRAVQVSAERRRELARHYLRALYNRLREVAKVEELSVEVVETSPAWNSDHAKDCRCPRCLPQVHAKPR